MNFTAEICERNGVKLKTPLVLGHYLPWFTDGNPEKFELSAKFADDIVMPEIEDWRHWRDCRSQYKRTHMYQPQWGEYDSRDPGLIWKQISTAKEHGLDGFIVNLYGKNSVENVLGLHFLEELKKYNSENPNDPFLYMVSFDSQAQWLSERKVPVSIEEDFEYIKNIWITDAHIKRDGAPVMAIFVYDKPCSEYRKAADEVFGKDGLDILWSSPDNAAGASGTYAWIAQSEIGANGSWFNPDDAGDRFLSDFYERSNKNSDLKYIMGGVWPGFNDNLVSWAWNPSQDNPEIRPRVMCRETTRGNTLELTWEANVKYICELCGKSDKLQMPLIQIVTWNDWAESTNIEPDMDFGYKCLETCKNFIKEIKSL